jgi:hypothetical protein
LTPSSPLNVLLVGAGYRIANSFLPTLWTLRDRFTVIGVHAPSATRRDPLAALWGIPPVASLEGPEALAADVVAISVPTPQNAAVLSALLPHAARLRLVVDTPGASTLRELAALAPLLARFKSVAFTEDHMNFPVYALLRRAVARGLIGEPRSLTLFHTGYRYHGLAILRAFAGLRPVARGWRRRVGAWTTVVGYQFHGGFEGCVINPYHRDQPDGGLILEGDSGIVTAFPADLEMASPSRPVYLIKQRHQGGLLSGYAIEAGSRSLDLDLPGLASMREMPIGDKSDHNLRRACGMANVFRSIREPEADPETRLNAAYGWKQALYDSFASRLAEGGRLPFDPFTLASGDFMSVLVPASRLVARFGGARHAAARTTAPGAGQASTAPWKPRIQTRPTAGPPSDPR